MHSTGFFITALIAIAFLLGSLLMALFEPALRYRICEALSCGSESDEFRRIVEAAVGTIPSGGTIGLASTIGHIGNC